jgi:hypothetical protein
MNVVLGLDCGQNGCERQRGSGVGLVDGWNWKGRLLLLLLLLRLVDGWNWKGRLLLLLLLLLRLVDGWNWKGRLLLLLLRLVDGWNWKGLLLLLLLLLRLVDGWNWKGLLLLLRLVDGWNWKGLLLLLRLGWSSPQAHPLVSLGGGCYLLIGIFHKLFELLRLVDERVVLVIGIDEAVIQQAIDDVITYPPLRFLELDRTPDSRQNLDELHKDLDELELRRDCIHFVLHRERVYPLLL